jgi:hypothetical protein
VYIRKRALKHDLQLSNRLVPERRLQSLLCYQRFDAPYQLVGLVLKEDHP